MQNIKAFQPVVHEKKIFEDLSNLSLFCPLFCSFLWTNLNLHPSSMFPTKFSWNWPSTCSSWEEDF